MFFKILTQNIVPYTSFLIVTNQCEMHSEQYVVEIESGFACNQSNSYLYENGSSKWVICEAIELLCFAVALYLLYALLHHRLIQNKRQSKYLSKQVCGFHASAFSCSLCSSLLFVDLKIIAEISKKLFKLQYSTNTKPITITDTLLTFSFSRFSDSFLFGLFLKKSGHKTFTKPPPKNVRKMEVYVK